LIKRQKLIQQGVTQRPSAELDSQALASAGFWTWLSRDDSVRAIQSRYGQRKFQMTAQLEGEAPLTKMSADLNKSAHERDRITKEIVSFMRSDEQC
jgi:hypothetical protein